MPTTTDGTGTLGPGTLKIGPIGAPLTISCFVNNARIVPDVDEGDTKTMLCGTTKRSADTIDWSLQGNLDSDFGYGDGFAAYTWAHAGEVSDFEFTPSSAVGTTVKGQLKVVPLEFGADDYGDYLDSDIEFGLVDFNPAVALTFGEETGSPAVDGTVPVQDVTAGTPGAYTPATATPPTDLAALKAHPIIGDEGTNHPTTAWTVGQNIVLGDGSTAFWDSISWQAGSAPAADEGF
jgi:hypothetical protein